MTGGSANFDLLTQPPIGPARRWPLPILGNDMTEQQDKPEFLSDDYVKVKLVEVE